MNKRKILNKKSDRRAARTRAKLLGTSQKPRLSIFRSNKFTYAQLIDDSVGKTLVSVSTREIKKDAKMKDIKKIILSESLGEALAKKAMDKKIEAAIFDRGKYKYHGRVKTVAESARKTGLKI